MSLGFQSYGLWLRSDQPLHGADVSESPPRIDVELVLATDPPGSRELLDADAVVWSVSPYLSESGVPSIVISTVLEGAYYRLRYCDGAEFFIDKSGSWIWARRPDSLTAADISSYLMGPVLGFVLRLRGIPCLHASAVSIGGRVVAFAGPSGAGKTTLAAAFARLGFPMVTDDILALENRASRIWAKPGYPRLRLWATSIDALAPLASHLPHLQTPSPGQRHHLDVTRDGYLFERQERPLAAVYVLQDRVADASAPRVDAYLGQECLMALVGNSYASSLFNGATRAKEFELLSELTATVPVRRLHPHLDPRRLGALCEAVLADLDQFPTLDPRPVATAV